MVAKKEKLILILFVNAVVFYILEGLFFNPLIVWILLPFYVGYFIVNNAWKMNSKKKLWGGYGFLVASIGYSYLYHIEWYFDINDTETMSSTSALIFFGGPIMAVFIGFIGYFIGYFVSDDSKEDGE